MKTRVLPPEEWPRLKGTEAELLWPHLDPEHVRVIVVEDGDRIVGLWILMRIAHAECLWAAPEYRGSVTVARGLINTMRKLARDWGQETVLTASTNEHVTELITKFGGFPTPYQNFILPTRSPTARRQDKALGHDFHEQLKALHADTHDEDPEHDERVGRAIRTAFLEKDPEGAEKAYNRWARMSGYAEIRFLGENNGKLLVDIASAIIEVDRDYRISIVDQPQENESESPREGAS